MLTALPTLVVEQRLARTAAACEHLEDALTLSAAARDEELLRRQSLALEDHRAAFASAFEALDAKVDEVILEHAGHAGALQDLEARLCRDLALLGREETERLAQVGDIVQAAFVEMEAKMGDRVRQSCQEHLACQWPDRPDSDLSTQCSTNAAKDEAQATLFESMECRVSQDLERLEGLVNAGHRRFAATISDMQLATQQSASTAEDVTELQNQLRDLCATLLRTKTAADADHASLGSDLRADVAEEIRELKDIVAEQSSLITIEVRLSERIVQQLCQQQQGNPPWIQEAIAERRVAVNEVASSRHLRDMSRMRSADAALLSQGVLPGSAKLHPRRGFVQPGSV